MLKNDPPITLQYFFDVCPSVLWKAITELSKMQEWFFAEIPEFQAVQGFEVSFDVQGENCVFPHHWTITEVIPNQKIVYNWNYIGFIGDASMSFEIKKEDTKSKLILCMKTLESFDTSYAEFKRESCIAGWNYFMDRLKNFLAL